MNSVVEFENLNQITEEGYGKSDLVHLTRHKSNSELFDWMNANPYEEIGRLKAEQAVVGRSTKWRLRDRLSERDMVRMIMASKTGIAKEELADRYGIHINSVKKLLREHGALHGRSDIVRGHFQPEKSWSYSSLKRNRVQR